MAILLSGQTARAQYVTYNHDSSKMNQVLVMETGASTLTPEVYYLVTHGKYKQWANAQNKQSFRTSVGAAAWTQTKYADSIAVNLRKRANIEAENMADRKIDLAWKTEGTKVSNAMTAFQKNINRIIAVGGTAADHQRWMEYYNIYSRNILSTKQAYMPNAQRKKSYLRIYEDVTRQNEILLQYIVACGSRRKTQVLLAARPAPKADKTAIIEQAKDRWNRIDRDQKT